MKVLIVEDDYLEEELIRKLLTGRRFNLSKSEIETITTEEEFQEKVRAIAKGPNPPALVIMDVMIRWTDPKPGELNLDRIPEEVKKDGPYRAGLRCAELLDRLNPKIPILFYTILDRADLDGELLMKRAEERNSNVDYAQKDVDDSMLIEKLNRYLLSETS